MLRSRSPRDVRAQYISDHPGPWHDPAFPSNPIDPIRMQLDHIVPFSHIVEMDGFARLTTDNQLEILNLEDNLVPMDSSTNASRGNKPWSRFREVNGVAIDAGVRTTMATKEAQLRTVIEQKIQEKLKAQEAQKAKP
jgi:hypothetical protein